MKRNVLMALLLTMVFLSISVAGDFNLYPGAKLDEKATKEARDMAAAAKMTNVKASIYTTADSFAKVTSFYQSIAKEYSMPRASGSSGKPKKYEKYDLWEAYFIFDGAKDLGTSKLWIKIQRPYIGEDVRDVTAIVVSEKK